jgi:hypothetical protein
MSDIKQKIYFILDSFCTADGDEKYSDTLKRYVDEIEAVYTPEINKLKCCGNCKHYYFFPLWEIYKCDIKKTMAGGDELCDKWEASE